MATDIRPLKERQREEREQLILRAAHELILEKGGVAVTMEEIAAKVGISRAAIYLHFPSKEDLILVMMERGMRAFVESLNSTLDAPGTPREKLQAVIEQIFQSFADRQAFSDIFQSRELMHRLAEKRASLVAALAQPSSSEDELHHLAEKRASLVGHWEEPMRRIAVVLEEGKATGEFDPTMPTSVMLSILSGLFASHRSQYTFQHEQLPPDVFAKQVSRFFFKGVAPDNAEEIHEAT